MSSDSSPVLYIAPSTVSKIFIMQTGQQRAPRGCDRCKERVSGVCYTVMQISTRTSLDKVLSSDLLFQIIFAQAVFIACFPREKKKKEKNLLFDPIASFHYFFFLISIEIPVILVEDISAHGRWLELDDL